LTYIGLEDYAIGCICSGITSISNEDEEWQLQLSTLGFSNTFILWQLDDDVRRVRAMSTMEEWLEQIPQARVSALIKFHSICRQAATGSQAKTDEGESGPIQLPTQKTQGIPPHVNKDGSISAVLSVQQVMGEQSGGIPGFLSLYKGCRFVTAGEFMRENPSIETGLYRATASACGDFSIANALCLTTQRWVAIYHARGYLRGARTASTEPPVILQLLIP